MRGSQGVPRGPRLCCLQERLLIAQAESSALRAAQRRPRDFMDEPQLGCGPVAAPLPWPWPWPGQNPLPRSHTLGAHGNPGQSLTHGCHQPSQRAAVSGGVGVGGEGGAGRETRGRGGQRSRDSRPKLSRGTIVPRQMSAWLTAYRRHFPLV